MIEQAIAKAHEAGPRVGLCGQAPSNDPDLRQASGQGGHRLHLGHADSFLDVKTQRGGGGKSRELIPGTIGRD
jgi:pyruvate,water dikinase